MPLLNNVFVLIDTKNLRYARYVARTEREVWFSDRLLTPPEVETMRMTPEALEDPHGPEAA